MKRNKLRRVTATALLLSFALPQCAYAAAPTVETDEAVYINMDYYGVPTNTRIVKGANLNGHTEFTDFGDYKDVYNMSTFDEPVLKDGSTPTSSASTMSVFRTTRSISRCRGTSMCPTS